jgi:SPP1 gp7 family putative phage head morphogenesis protein
MTTDFLLKPTPFAEAAQFLADKPAVTREVFDQLLPELRARAFTVAGLSAADDLRSVRDAVAALARGESWKDSKDTIIGLLVGKGDEDSTTAVKHAELVLRMNGFMAYSAAGEQLAQETKDELPYAMYNSMEDDRVRPEHAALDGLVFALDDIFWTKFTPPWDWGCRCWKTYLSQLAYDRVAAGQGYGRILGPAEHKRFNLTGELDDGAGHVITITTPAQRAVAAGEDPALAWHWSPGDLRIPLDGLRARYAADPLTWACFESFAKSEQLTKGISVWDWLNGAQL